MVMPLNETFLFVAGTPRNSPRLRSGDRPVDDQLVLLGDGVVDVEVQVGQAREEAFHLSPISGRANGSAGYCGIADRVGVGDHELDEFHPPLIPDGMIQAAEQFFVSLGDGHGAFLPRNTIVPVCD